METLESQTDLDIEIPENQEINRDSVTGRWRKGYSGNLAGRPRGKTMKEWVREYLSKLTDEEREEWMHGLPKSLAWRMAEGNPESKVDAKLTGNITGYKNLTDEQLARLATTGTLEGDSETGSEQGDSE